MPAATVDHERRRHPRVAYNSTRDEIVVTWKADDQDHGQDNDELEILARRLAAPRNVTPPAISGNAASGGTLNCSQGIWENGPTAFAFQWLRGGVAVGGATASSYVVSAADLGQTIECQVTASNDPGSRSATSARCGAAQQPDRRRARGAGAAGAHQVPQAPAPQVPRARPAATRTSPAR